MNGWLVAYDAVQRKVLGVYEQRINEGREEFIVRARQIIGIWGRLRPSAVVEMRLADSFDDLVQRNPRIFRTARDVERAAAHIGYQGGNPRGRHARRAV